MRRSARFVFGIAALSALGWLGACQGDSAGPNGGVDPDPTGDTDTVTLNASNALPVASLASLSLTGPADVGMAAQFADGDVTYISLKPGTVANGLRVVISNPRLAGTVTAAMTDGGFDPIPVRASAGDVIEIAVATATGERRFSVRVPPAREPRVVRTVPPRGKTAVTLNANIVIVFSEPVAGGSLTPTTVQVLRRGTPIAGTARLLEGSTTAAVFDPSEPLAPNTTYKLVVNTGVTDLAGNSLSGRVVRDFTTGSALAEPVSHVRVRPDSLAIAVGDQAQLIATAIDFNGNPIEGLPITWSSQNSAVASVSAAGLVTGAAPSGGEVRVSATVGGQTGEAVFVVGSLVPIASVELSTDSSVVRVGGSQWLYVFLKDREGNTLSLPRLTQWTSSNPAVATVADSGSRTAFVKGVREGLARITVWVEGKSDTVSILVSNTASNALRIIATAPSNGATQISRRTTVSVTFSNVINTVTMGPGNNSSAFTVTGASGAIVGEISTDQNYKTYVFTPSRPLDPATTYTGRITTAVRDGSDNSLPADYVWTFTTESESPPFTDAASISSHRRHTCILTTSGSAYCWGDNSNGQFGDTTLRSAGYAVLAAGNLKFVGLGAGASHTCGVDAANAAYCWGNGWEGQLGIGAAIPRREPTQVAGELSFASVTAGLWHTCGVTTEGSAYCWGNNSYGVLGVGDGTSTPRPTPVSVVGGLTFRRVTAGVFHTCGVTTERSAYCWGNNSTGELGDGTTDRRVAPVPVAGGLSFDELSAGFSFTCGVTPEGAAYCWGGNPYGALGDGTTISRPTPVPVTGGLHFTAVTTGEYHSCGVTVAGAAYCWGGNTFGQLGDGTTTHRTAPVPVAGGITFAAIASGLRHSCGVTTSGGVYCWGENSVGQLGNGSTTNSAIPVRVSR